MRSKWVAIVLGLTLVAATAAAPAGSERQATTAGLDFRAVLGLLISTSAPCPADRPPNTTECRARTVSSGIDEVLYLVPGLGLVSGTYTLPLGLGPPTCPADLAKPLATTGRLVVAGRGEIAFALSEGARCVGHDSAQDEPQAFTITGGTGQFGGASGGGTLVRGWDAFGSRTETWTGTLTGLHLTLPKLTGAIAQTVRAAKGAKGARVSFKVTATDDDGGDIPTSCWPESGSRFPLGKTIVQCAATDSSGNTATAGFTVTVTRRR